MPFVKKVRKRTKQGYKTYLYLARNYREGGKIKQEIIRSLTAEEVQELQQGSSLVSSRRDNSKTPFSEVEHLRSENKNLIQKNSQLEGELAQERSRNLKLNQKLGKRTSQSGQGESAPSHRTKQKRKTKKISLQQFLSS